MEGRWMEEGASLNMDTIVFRKDGQRCRRVGPRLLNLETLKTHFMTPSHPLRLFWKKDFYFYGGSETFRYLGPGQSVHRHTSGEIVNF